MKILRTAKRILFPPNRYRKSYSQRGEDLILEDFLNMLNIRHPIYLDIGTNDPIIFNNTFLFYKKGGHGICIEPNPGLAKQIKSTRPRDICLNIGISGKEQEEVSFFVFDNDALSTFSAEQAKKLELETSYKIIRTDKVKMKTIGQVIAENPVAKSINLISLDCEGLDIEILENLDFQQITPEFICIETVGCVDSENTSIRRQVQKILHEYYAPVADTYLNTIYARKEVIQPLKMSPLEY